MKVGESVKFGDKGISVDEARKQMLAAGEAPKGIAAETAKNKAVGVSDPPQAPIVPKAAPVTSARLTLVNEDGSDGASQVVTEKTAAELDATIRRTHAKAFANKQKIRVELLTEEAVAAEPVVVIETPAALPPPVAPVPTPAEDDAVDRYEDSKFVAEIKKENGQWVAEITYKNGAGKERFEAPSRKALDMKLIVGKAHGTLRVRESIRREKYGTDLDKVYTLPDYLTQAAYDALPKEAQQAMIDNIATTEALVWHQQYPENYVTDDNSIKIQKFLNKRDLPFTARNLQYAYEELLESDELELRPASKIVAPSVPVSAPPAGDSVAAAVPVASVVPTPAAPAAPAPTVRKRGSTGLQPGQSSAANTELEQPEEAAKPRELSEAELRALPMDQLRALHQKTLKQNRHF